MTQNTLDAHLEMVLQACHPDGMLPADIGAAERDELVAALVAHGARVTGDRVFVAEPVELLSADQVAGSLQPEAAGWLAELMVSAAEPSTNTALMEAASHGSVEGTVRTTEYQTAGRGRRGRGWFSLYGRNIAVSFGMQFAHPAALAGWSLAVGIAVARALDDVGATEVRLKWPNDVWWRNRKLAGILVETQGAAPLAVVTGIGINVYLPAPAREQVDQPVTDVDECVGRRVSRNSLLTALINRVVEVRGEFDRHELAGLQAEWEARDALRGLRVQIEGAKPLVGVACGINAAGELLLDDGGTVHRVAGGELSVRVDHD